MKLIVGTLCVLAVLLPAGAQARVGKTQRVTLIGDSVSEAVRLDSGATQILSAGIVLQQQTAVCRRLVVESCPGQDGTDPQTALQVIHQLGPQLGSTVIMAVGYNDPEAQYAGEISTVLAALHQAGVQHILWPTLIAVRHSYVDMNADIRAAAAKDPSVSVVDWNLYARSHPTWFASDGLHLYGDGAQAMATLFHKWLVKVKVAPGSVKAIQKLGHAATNQHRYVTKLKATGGYPPYLWHAVHLPPGWQLTPSGWLAGTPHTKARLIHMLAWVTDSTGARAYAHITLPVHPH